MRFRWATTPTGVGIYLLVGGALQWAAIRTFTDVHAWGAQIQVGCGLFMLFNEERRRLRQERKRMALEKHDCAGGRQIALRDGAEPNPFWDTPCPNEGTDPIDMATSKEQDAEVHRLHMCRAHLLALHEHRDAHQIK